MPNQVILVINDSKAKILALPAISGDPLSFLGELKRRNVFRVAAAYVVASWLIIQIVSAVDAPLNLPDWFDTVVIVLLAVGFPVVILFAWAFELTPEGIKASSLTATAEHQPVSSRLDIALIGALMLVAGVIVWNQFESIQGDREFSTTPTVQGTSIAVLPFTDMSPEGDQAYFGDGIAEEVLNELTRLEGLRVAGRTSSFSFRGGDRDIRAIGESLNVDLVLEGSVRKDGNRIRITTQLVDTRDGFHHWSETYDRHQNDLFAIQDEIADTIAGMLGVRLGVGDVNSFRGAGTDSLEAYESYLYALTLPLMTQDRVRALERAVQLDPNYAAALAELGLSLASTTWAHQPEEAPQIMDRALPYLHRAVNLHPESAYANTLLATVNYAKFQWKQSERYYENALAISRDGGTLSNFGNMLMRSGRSEAAIRVYTEAARAERYPTFLSELNLNAYIAMQRFSEARDNAAKTSSASRIDYLLALNQSSTKALRALLSEAPRNTVQMANLGIPLLEVLESPNEALDLLKSVYSNRDVVWPSKYHDVALLAAFYGAPAFSLEVFSNELVLTTLRFGALWYPVMSNVRQQPEFKDLMEKVNLPDYWRDYGWPNHCRPLGPDDFECF